MSTPSSEHRGLHLHATTYLSLATIAIGDAAFLHHMDSVIRFICMSIMTCFEIHVLFFLWTAGVRSVVVDVDVDVKAFLV